MRILLLIACLTFPGCADFVGKALTNAIAPNPENKRIATEAQKDRDAYDTIKDPNVDKEKAEMVKEIRLESSKQSHPSFFSSIVSGLYTEEGRMLAGKLVAGLTMLGVMGWKIGQAYFLKIDLNRTLLGNQELRRKLPDHSTEIKETLAKAHGKRRFAISKRLKKILGEI